MQLKAMGSFYEAFQLVIFIVHLSHFLQAILWSSTQSCLVAGQSNAKLMCEGDEPKKRVGGIIG